jgi:hypothetical protein
MKSFKTHLNEAKSGYAIYHPTLSSAVAEVVAQVEKAGFTMDEDDFFQKVSNGPRKPSEGKTNSYKVDLLKDGKPVKKMAVFQVYGMGNRYELNFYIS